MAVYASPVALIERWNVIGDISGWEIASDRGNLSKDEQDQLEAWQGAEVRLREVNIEDAFFLDMWNMDQEGNPVPSHATDSSGGSG